MKIFLLIFVLVWMTFPTKAQTTYIANNNLGAVGGANTFTGSNALFDAIAAATTGDIIYVVPSPNTYGDVNFNKEITVFGIGFNPDNAATLKSIIGDLGPVNISASNLRLSGLTFNQEILTNGDRSNIIIDHCNIKRIDPNTGSDLGNIVIQNNILGRNVGSNSATETIFISNASSGVLISNNIIYGTSSGLGGFLRIPDGSIVESNLFIGNSMGSNVAALNNVSNSSIKNNIFFGVRPASSGTFTNNSFEYNISFGSGDDSFSIIDGNTSFMNITGQDPLLVNISYGQNFNFSEDPNLQVGSPAEGMGEAGIDMGVFGGGSPFDLTGTPLPIIQSLDLPPTISQGSDLPINIKGRGN